MIIDVAFVILLFLAVIKGYSRGFIVALVSFLAVFIGLAAALKLSTWVAEYLSDSTGVSVHWLPFISFALVMFGVVLLVRILARIIQKSVELVMLGWINRLAGIFFYLLLYVTVLSVILFYANQMQMIKAETLDASVTYPFLAPWAPRAMDIISFVLPFFKDMFADLSNFFGSLPQKTV